MKALLNATRIDSELCRASSGVLMDSNFYRYLCRSLGLGLAATATYLLVWGLVTTHPEIEVPAGAAPMFALYAFLLAFVSNLALSVSRHAGQRKH
ncbi:MAG: hypothetical protein JOZ36_03395 [Acidobacteria bacterium]|nr:hypothetical protein [Acidobacteriota bacterium]